jgi:predicted enzyme related to lactoylglutathione lyase
MWLSLCGKSLDEIQARQDSTWLGRHTRGSMPTTFAHGKVVYVEIPATDIKRSADFYSKVFGWRIKQRADGSTEFDDTVSEMSGTWVVGRAVSENPGLLIFIMVDNVAATADEIVRQGGRVEPWIASEPPEMSRFSDPAGNVLGLFQKPPV